MSVIRPWGCGSYFAQCSVHPALALSFNFNSSIQLEPTCRCVLRVPPLLRACLCALCLALCVCFMRVRLCALCARVLLFECLFFLFCLFVCLLTCILVFVFVFFVWCSEYSHWRKSQSAAMKTGACCLDCQWKSVLGAIPPSIHGSLRCKNANMKLGLCCYFQSNKKRWRLNMLTAKSKPRCCDTGRWRGRQIYSVG